MLMFSNWGKNNPDVKFVAQKTWQPLVTLDLQQLKPKKGERKGRIQVTLYKISGGTYYKPFEILVFVRFCLDVL